LTEELLEGGVANVGGVVRVGDTVRRPVGPQTLTVHAFLRHLEAVGFDGAPRVLGFDEAGREILTFIPGEVAVPPELPAWAIRDELLVTVARLQRRLHGAASGFEPPGDAVWAPGHLPVTHGTLVCHADICMENVVVRHGTAAAFIDFDHAAPMDRRMDIAVACRHWVPLRDPVDLEPALAGIGQVRRFRAFCDAHALTRPDRAVVLDLLADFLVRALPGIRARAEAGHPGFGAMWRSGYAERNLRARRWLETTREALIG
jgi:hypothetical protein